MKVDFRRLTWENYPSTETPINADNLNRLEEGVAGLYSDVAEIEQELGDGVGEYVTDWLNEHVDPVGSAVVVDDTLSIEGAAADAKKTGDEISSLKEDLSNIEETVINNSDVLKIDIPFIRGRISNGEYATSTSSFATKELIPINAVDWCILDDSALVSYICYFDENKVYKKYQTVTAGLGQYALDKTYSYFRTSLGYLSSSDVLPESALDTYHFYKNVVSDKNAETTADNFENMWVLGGINSSTGALNYGSNVTYISPAFISKKIKRVEPKTGYFVAVFAYSDGGYVGVYNGSTFTTNYAVRTVPVDFSSLRSSFPKYDFKLLIGNLQSDVTHVKENIVIYCDATYTHEDYEELDVRQALEQAQNIRVSGSQLTLIHFSDIHGNGDRLQSIVNFGNNYSAYINDIICTGDLVGGKYSDGIAFWDAVEGAERILTCIGNHDALTAQTGGSLIDMSTLCSTFITPYIANWGNVVHPTDATYYYKDYTTQSIRLIVLDVMHSDAAQLTWLEGVLNDAKTNNLHVLIAIHYPAYPRTIINCDFSPAKDLANYDTATIPADVLSLVDTFQSNGGNFICYLTGHEHTDFMLTPQSYPNQLVVCITCASNVYGQWQKSDQYRYDSFSDAFNITTVNTKEKTISIKRIGADMDMFLRKRETFSYDYGTHTLIN